MSETKHTPGPWPIERRRNAITAIGPCVADEYGGFAWLDVSKADAGLIAAAPDLLEALQTVVANAPEPYCAITRAIDAQCRAAIAKATGEQQ